MCVISAELNEADIGRLVEMGYDRAIVVQALTDAR